MPGPTLNMFENGTAPPRNDVSTTAGVPSRLRASRPGPLRGPVVSHQVREPEHLERAPRLTADIHEEHVPSIGLELPVRLEEHRDSGGVDERQMFAVNEQVRTLVRDRASEIGAQLWRRGEVDFAAEGEA